MNTRKRDVKIDRENILEMKIVSGIGKNPRRMIEATQSTAKSSFGVQAKDRPMFTSQMKMARALIARIDLVTLLTSSITLCIFFWVYLLDLAKQNSWKVENMGLKVVNQNKRERNARVL